MSKLFPNERDLLESLAEMTPGQQAAAAETYVENGRAMLRDASAADLAEELRNPSTKFHALTQAVFNEAIARIVTTCAL